MRPKKTILMYAANEITRQVLEFQIQTWGYNVISTSELCLMPATLRSRSCDLVLMLPGFEHARRREFHNTAQQCEILQMETGGSIRIYDTQQVLPENVAPSIHRIPNVSINAAEYLRVQLKNITARKRGPKKHNAAHGLAACA